MSQLKIYKNLLKNRLQGKRFEHCVNVMEKAVALAKLYGVKENNAAMAGLLHDYAKNLSPEQLKKEIEILNIQLDDTLEKHMILAHGLVGAEMIRRDLEIENEDVLNAIRYHTYGRCGMSDLEKIIYLADFIEPGRKFKGAEELRKLANKDLDKGVLKALELSIEFLLGSDRLIHPNTILARNELVIKINLRRHHGSN